MNTKILNTDESLELTLFAENDYEVYNNAIMPVVRCLSKKFKAGTFDMTKAHKAFVNVAVFAAKKYAADFGGVYYRLFSPSDRRLTAASLLETYMDDIKESAEE